MNNEMLDQNLSIMSRPLENPARYYKYSIPASPPPKHKTSNEMMEIKEMEKEKEKLEDEKKGVIELVMRKVGLALTTNILFKIVMFKAIINMIAFGCLIYSVIGLKSNTENYSTTTTTPIYSTSNEDEQR